MLRLPKLAHHCPPQCNAPCVAAAAAAETSPRQRSYLGRRQLPLWIDDRCWCSWPPPRLQQLCCRCRNSDPTDQDPASEHHEGEGLRHCRLAQQAARTSQPELVAARASSAGRCAGTLSGVGVVTADRLGLYRGGLRRSIEPSPPVHSLAGLGRVLAMVTCSSRNSDMVLQVLAATRLSTSSESLNAQRHGS
jgi:hypothetical protein